MRIKILNLKTGISDATSETISIDDNSSQDGNIPGFDPTVKALQSKNPGTTDLQKPFSDAEVDPRSGLPRDIFSQDFEAMKGRGITSINDPTMYSLNMGPRWSDIKGPLPAWCREFRVAYLHVPVGYEKLEKKGRGRSKMSLQATLAIGNVDQWNMLASLYRRSIPRMVAMIDNPFIRAADLEEGSTVGLLSTAELGAEFERRKTSNCPYNMSEEQYMSEYEYWSKTTIPDEYLAPDYEIEQSIINRLVMSARRSRKYFKRRQPYYLSKIKLDTVPGDPWGSPSKEGRRGLHIISIFALHHLDFDVDRLLDFLSALRALINQGKNLPNPSKLYMKLDGTAGAYLTSPLLKGIYVCDERIPRGMQGNRIRRKIDTFTAVDRIGGMFESVGTIHRGVKERQIVMMPQITNGPLHEICTFILELLKFIIQNIDFKDKYGQEVKKAILLMLSGKAGDGSRFDSTNGQPSRRLTAKVIRGIAIALGKSVKEADALSDLVIMMFDAPITTINNILDGLADGIQPGLPSGMKITTICGFLAVLYASLLAVKIMHPNATDDERWRYLGVMLCILFYGDDYQYSAGDPSGIRAHFALREAFRRLGLDYDWIAGDQFLRQVGGATSLTRSALGVISSENGLPHPDIRYISVGMKAMMMENHPAAAGYWKFCQEAMDIVGMRVSRTPELCYHFGNDKVRSAGLTSKLAEYVNANAETPLGDSLSTLLKIDPINGLDGSEMQLDAWISSSVTAILKEYEVDATELFNQTFKKITI